MLNQITLITTYRCDLHCQHCLQGFPKKHEDFPVELFDKLLTEAMPFGAKHISFTGGEAHLHPEFPKLVEKAVAYGYTWSLISHGYRAEPYLPLMERFRDKFIGIGISIDGSYSALHDELRGKKGAFGKTTEAVRQYVEKGFRVEIKSSLNQKNKGEVQALIELAENLGAESILFAGTIPTSWNQHLVLTDQESLQLYQQLIDLQGKSKVKVKTASALYTKGGINFCNILNLSHLTFNPRSEMMFCCDIDHDGALIGSLRNHSLAELVQSWLEQSAKLQAQRAEQISTGTMRELFDTCDFCNRYFRKTEEINHQ
jgi:MoaA/NifB/PqqE/SkfB family radical SAM enzyme